MRAVCSAAVVLTVWALVALQPAAQAAIRTAGNDIYTIYIDDEACGAWTATTGPSHPAGSGYNVLYGEGQPWSSFTTLRTASTDWTTSSNCSSLCASATPTVSDIYGPNESVIGLRFQVTIEDGGRSVEFTQDVVVGSLVDENATVDDTLIRETHTIRNLGPGSFEFGLRKMWDWRIAFNDAPWFGVCADPGAGCDRSMDLMADGSADGPYPDTYLVNPYPGTSDCPNAVVPNDPSGCPNEGLFIVGGTAGAVAALTPSPTPPNLLQFNAWFELFFDCWRPPLTDAAFCTLDECEECEESPGDTAMAYFYGLDTPIVLAENEERSFTQYIGSSESGTCPVQLGDVNPPLCAGEPGADPPLGVGSATELKAEDTGIYSVEFLPGAVNATLNVAAFTPGASNVSWEVERQAAGAVSAVVVVTDGLGQTCSVTYTDLPGGPVENEVVCLDNGILVSVSHDNPTPGGPVACSQNTGNPNDPELPPGYEPSPEDDPFPCTTFTLDSPLAGPIELVYKKDGDFDSRLRLLFSRFDGIGFPPFTDITQIVEPITYVVPDPTRLGGQPIFSLVKVTCAILAEICDGLDNDGDGDIDEGLPVGEPPVDADGDGVPVCPAFPGGPFDCADQLSEVFPGAVEICNGIDDDCDGEIDEGFDADGDGIYDCFDNCPTEPNPLQEDADADGLGDVCDEDYFSVLTNHSANGSYLQQQSVYRATQSAAPINLEASFVPSARGLDAVDVEDDFIYFSVASNGLVGPLNLQQQRIYRFNRDTAQLSLAPQGVGLNPGSLDALDVTGETLVFSTSSNQTLSAPGCGSTYLNQANGYRFDPATGCLTLAFNGAGVGLQSLDAIDVFPDGRVAFSTATNQFLATPLGSVYVQHRNAYVWNPANGAVTLALDGGALGLQSLDALTLAAGQE